MPSEPVADVVCIAMVQSHADGAVEEEFEIGEPVGVDEVAGFLEGVVDVGVGFGIVQVHAKSVLDVRKIKIFYEVGWGSWIYVWMTDAGN